MRAFAAPRRGRERTQQLGAAGSIFSAEEKKKENLLQKSSSSFEEVCRMMWTEIAGVFGRVIAPTPGVCTPQTRGETRGRNAPIGTFFVETKAAPQLQKTKSVEFMRKTRKMDFISPKSSGAVPPPCKRKPSPAAPGSLCSGPFQLNTKRQIEGRELKRYSFTSRSVHAARQRLRLLAEGPAHGKLHFFQEIPQNPTKFLFNYSFPSRVSFFKTRFPLFPHEASAISTPPRPRDRRAEHSKRGNEAPRREIQENFELKLFNFIFIVLKLKCCSKRGLAARGSSAGW